MIIRLLFLFPIVFLMYLMERLKISLKIEVLLFVTLLLNTLINMQI